MATENQNRGPQQNHLLASLPEQVLKRWQPELERVELSLGQVLHESMGRMTFVYFPLDVIVSQLYDLFDGSSVEIAMVGSDGMVGFPLFMGGETTPSRAVVQNRGHGYRMKAAFIKNEFGCEPSVARLMLRYMQSMIMHMTQTVACNRLHSVDQRLCRWLLASLDRLQCSELAMTQERIANIIGVRREGVSAGAAKLQRAGFIRSSRGHITVLDRPGLESCVCECYQTVHNEYVRLLPQRAPPSTLLTGKDAGKSRAAISGGSVRCRTEAAAAIA